MSKLLRPYVASCVVMLCAFLTVSVDAAEQGTALWFDLVTEDSKASAAFYEGLFGWKIEDTRNGELLVSHRGRDIAGIIPITDKQPEASESQWLVGIVVDDLEKAVSVARAGGGKVLRDVTKIAGSGSYAVIRDPQGAPLILGTPSREIGGPREHGFFAWVEMWADDTDAAAEFYGQVIGYTTKTLDRPGGAYTVFQSGGQARAGLVKTPHDDVQPVWAPYVGVDDLGTILKETVKLGGRVVLAPRDDFGGGRVALIEDPAKAMVFVAQLPKEGESR